VDETQARFDLPTGEVILLAKNSSNFQASTEKRYRWVEKPVPFKLGALWFDYGAFLKG